jgi:hypothetical protein
LRTSGREPFGTTLIPVSVSYVEAPAYERVGRFGGKCPLRVADRREAILELSLVPALVLEAAG